MSCEIETQPDRLEIWRSLKISTKQEDIFIPQNDVVSYFE